MVYTCGFVYLRSEFENANVQHVFKYVRGDTTGNLNILVDKVKGSK